MSVHIDPQEWRLETEGGVRYKRLAGSPRGTFNEDGSASVEEEIIIQASDLEAFLVESYPSLEAVEGMLSWTIPRKLPGTNYLFTKSIDFTNLDEGSVPSDPFGIDPEAPERTYDDFLKLTIKYQTAPENQQQQSQTYLKVSARASAEYLTVGARGDSKWGDEDGDDVEDIDVPINQIVSETEWTVSWPRVKRDAVPVLFGQARPFMGTVNSSDLGILYGAAAETVLFTGMSFDQTFIYDFSSDDNNQNPGGSIQVTLLEKRILTPDGIAGHNHFFRPSTGKFERIVKPDGSYVYPAVNLNALF